MQLEPMSCSEQKNKKQNQGINSQGTEKMRGGIEASKRVMIASAAVAAAALGALILVAGNMELSRSSRPTALLSFIDFREKCLQSCHYDKAKDVHGKLQAMSKCESGSLSNHFITYQNECKANPANCDFPTMGCGGEFHADLLSR
jgi:hypothetical protein